MNPGSLKITLYSSPISDCSARLRLSLNLKGLPYDLRQVLISKSDNHDAEYALLNPARTVPTLVVDRGHEAEPVVLTQSIAALEFLEESIDNVPALLPVDPVIRAQVRSLVAQIATDIHPLTTHRVGNAIAKLTEAEKPKDASGAVYSQWDKHWIDLGLGTYDAMLVRTAGRYSVGDSVSLADVVLLPELWTAERAGMTLDKYPHIARVYRNLNALPAVASARQDPEAELH